ncbi:MAG: cupredoxin domain-containing protein [Ilumatobacteraceae bacterium]
MTVAAMAFVATLVTACGGSSTTADTTQSAGGTSQDTSVAAVAGPTITIANMAFGQPLTVAPGTEINVVNNDSVEHSVTSNTAGVFDVEVDGGEHKTLTAPSRPGEYAFHCKYHPSMTDTLIVK